jgi:Flp pilus assembly protein TadD
VLLVSAWRWLVRSQPVARARMLGAAVGVVVLVGLTVGTVRRNWEYRSGLAIWETVVERYPHARAHENLAIQLRDAGRVDEAIEHLRVAAPDLPDARHVLGSALIDRGDLAGGIAELQAFVQANPHDREIVSARDELASAQRTLIGGLLNEKRFSDAEVQARAFVSSRPDRSDAHNLLGVALASSGRLDAALQEFQAAVRLDPQASEPRNNLARALEQTQQSGR